MIVLFCCPCLKRCLKCWKMPDEGVQMRMAATVMEGASSLVAHKTITGFPLHWTPCPPSAQRQESLVRGLRPRAL